MLFRSRAGSREEETGDVGAGDGEEDADRDRHDEELLPVLDARAGEPARGRRDAHLGPIGRRQEVHVGAEHVAAKADRRRRLDLRRRDAGLEAADEGQEPGGLALVARVPARVDEPPDREGEPQIGRASCRERVSTIL